MTLWNYYYFLNYRWIKNVATLDLWFNVGKKKFFSWVDIIGKSSTLYETSNPQTRNFLNDECLKWGLNPQPFWPHSKALTTKPTPHKIKYDIARGITHILKK